MSSLGGFAARTHGAAAPEPQIDDLRRETIPIRPPRWQDGHRAVAAMIAAASLLFFAVSSLRHYLFRSGGLDLGFFDQAIYLISQGRPPISSFLNFHVLSDHAAVILYPLAVVYKIWPDPHALLLVQAVTLASGAWPVWRLAEDLGLTAKQSLALAAAYVMYPLVLTTNIFDFHPEIFAIPGLLWAIIAARENRKLLFIFGVCLTLACKEVLSLTVVAMGVWLLVFEKRRFFGAFAVAAGVVWFVFATQVLIPHFAAGKQPSGLAFYRYLGRSLPEVVANLFLKPNLVLSHLLSVSSVMYVLVLAVPLIWGLTPRTMAPLLAAAPAVFLNLISDNPGPRSPFYQYSVPVIPFLFMSVMLAVASGKSRIRSPRAIVAWAMVLLVVGGAARGKKIFMGGAAELESLPATYAAVARVEGEGNVLTTHEISPHLAHRPWIQTIGSNVPLRPLGDFDYVLLHEDHASVANHGIEFEQVRFQVSTSPDFERIYQHGDVSLFKRRSSSDIAKAARVE
jgi:uncharacterized membrane protein